jgi:hypothetical protein
MDPKQPPKRTRHEGSISVTVTEKSMGKTVDERTAVGKVELPEFMQQVTHPVYITVKGGITRNTGNYNSIQTHVQYSVPVFPGITFEQTREILDGCDAAYKAISDKVEEKLQEELRLALGGSTDDSPSHPGNSPL